jgi:RNA polymerase sigma-70 factor (ECF subfamily)
MLHVPASAAQSREIVELMPALRKFAYRFTSNENDADDLVQEVLKRAIEHLHQYSAGTSMKSWMFTIMRNLYATRYRAAKRESCGLISDVALQDVPVAASQEWNMRAIDVNTALLRLSTNEREALMLVSAGVSYIEAAHSGGCELGTIKSRVSRARHHLADLLGDGSVVEATAAS